jgi:hypothetical protein
MTKAEWIEVCGNELCAHRIEHFHPLEICDVGRISPQGNPLKAPPTFLLPNAIKLLEVLSDIRSWGTTTPILVNSWYRDRLYNYDVGGVSNSMHLQLGGADITKTGYSPEEVADMLDDHPDSDQFGIGIYPTFTHIDVRGMIGRDAPARWVR